MTANDNSSSPDFRRLFEAGPGLYLVLTPDLTIVAVSQAYLDATMTRREALLGHPLFEAFPDNPDDPEASGTKNLRASLERVQRERIADTMAVQKYDIRRPESEGGAFEVRYWSPVNTPILDDDGTLLYIVHRVEDVSEFIRIRNLGTEQSKRTEALTAQAEKMEAEIFRRAQEVSDANRKLVGMNAELARKEREVSELYANSLDLDRLKTEFFTNVSHELRTPLTLIIGPGERLLASGKLAAPDARELATILRNAHLLHRHVNDLLDVSKLEAGKLEVTWADEDFAGMARLVASQFESLFQQRKIELEVALPDVLQGQSDPDKLQRILLNLVSNAAKFTPAGGRVRLMLRDDPVRSSVCFEVADSGPGIQEKDRAAIFERFRQLDGAMTRKTGGTGLGLAIVKEFTELLGGSVSVQSAPEGGALFSVTLPRKAPSGAILQPSAGPVPLYVHSPEAGGGAVPAADREHRMLPHLLVVEDNPDMNRYITSCLEQAYAVSTAFDGRQALEMALARNPDLILSDLMMPRMSGSDLLHAVRSNRELEGIPFVLLTARGDEDQRVQLLRAGANDFLAKPFSSEELRARVDNLVARRRAELEIVELNRQLAERAHQLEASNAELEAFSTSVSHDIRSPLTAVEGIVRMLGNIYVSQLPAEARELLDHVDRCLGQMKQLTRDLLDFSKFASCKLRDEPIDLGSLAQEVFEELKAQTPGRKIHFIGRAAPIVRADRAMMRQVLVNLISNAIKFTSRTDDGRIEFEGDLREDEIVCAVRDNGLGFDSSHSDKLFKPFQRLANSVGEPGTGVGLSIVQRVISRHGGRVWAESPRAGGAVFGFSLPRSALAA